MNELDRGRDIHRLDIDLQQRPIADPGFVFYLDRVVAETDDEIGGPQKFALDLPAGPLDAAERERMILVDHALCHGRGGERQIVAFDDVAQKRGIGDAHGRRADDRDRAPVMRPVTSAAKPAEPSCAVSTNSTPPWRPGLCIATLGPMPKPRATPFALSIAIIRSALFMLAANPARRLSTGVGSRHR